MKKVIVLAIAVFSCAAFAQNYGYGSRNQNGGTTYDYRNGNTYNSTGSGYSGHNSNTGSTWNSQSYGGQTTGRDSHGNAWSYDRSSGVYQNYGTGETRTHGKRW